MHSDDLSFSQRSLFQQGYQRYTPRELRQLDWGLRFTPAVCSTITAFALYHRQPFLLFAVAMLGLWAFFFPARHPMDLVYNHGVRHLFGAMALPPNPLQRRLACLSAGVMNLAAGALFLAEMPALALTVGLVLLVLQAIVIVSHFCTLSWMYEGLMRLLGKWQVPLDAESARHRLAGGARLVDVRSAHEFAGGSLPGALNLPLEELSQHAEALREGCTLVFCASGMRAHIATEKLRSQGVRDVHNLGSLANARAATQPLGWEVAVEGG